MEHAQLTTELIHDLIVEPIPTLDICAKHELNLTQLRTILESDEFAGMLAELQAINRLRIPVFRHRAINALESIMLQQPTGSTHAETIRKAAALYLRTTTASVDPSAQPPAEAEHSTQQTHPSQSKSPPLPPRHHTPEHPPTRPESLINAAGQPIQHHPPPTTTERRSA